MLSISVFMLSGCSGCQLILARKLLELRQLFKVVHFDMLKPVVEEKCDVALVEGAVNGQEVETVKQIRKSCNCLIALGTCSSTGGIVNLKKSLGQEVYSLKEVVQVDYELRGCPVDEQEVELLLTELSIGKISRPKDAVVCVECKHSELPCLLERGKLCFGPITQAGCKARCIQNSVACIGCRGIAADANLSSFLQLLEAIKLKGNLYFDKL